MFIALMRWSSVSSNKACPSISCDRNSAAISWHPGKVLMKEHTCSTLHCEGLESRRQSEPLLLSTLLCSLSLSCSFSRSACKRSLVVIGPGGSSSSSLSIQIELEALWLLLVRWESCSCCLRKCCLDPPFMRLGGLPRLPMGLWGQRPTFSDLNRLKRFLQLTLNLLTHVMEQKRLDLRKVRAKPLFPQNSHSSTSGRFSAVCSSSAGGLSRSESVEFSRWSASIRQSSWADSVFSLSSGSVACRFVSKEVRLTGNGSRPSRMTKPSMRCVRM